MKLFRLQGVVVFVVLFGILAAGLLVFLDPVVRNTIREQGSQAVKSQIDLDSVAISLVKQSVHLGGLAMANPDILTENVFQIDSIALGFDGNLALRKKLIVDQMSVLGIRLNQKRQTPAKSFKPTVEQSATETASTDQPQSGGLSFLQGMDLQSPEDILKSETLQTLEAAKATRAQIEALNAKWRDRLQNDLNPQALENMKQKIADLKSGGPSDLGKAAGLAQDLLTAQKEIQGQIEKITGLKTELQNDLNEIRRKVAELKNLPQKDFERIKNKYSLDLQGGGNILGALLGTEFKTKLDKALRYYQMLQPYLSKTQSAPKEPVYIRGQGISVQFPESPPFPDFLIRDADLSLELQGIAVAGNLHNLSDNQKAYGKPAELDFKSGKSDKFDALSLHAVMDRTAERPRDTFKAKFESLKVADLSADNGLNLNQATVDIDALMEIANQEQLSGTISANVSGATIAMAGGDNEISKAIAESLASVDRFSIKIILGGTLESYDLKIQSNLDDVLSKAITNVVGAKVASFQKSLKNSIGAATSGALTDTDGLLAGLTGNQNALNSQESAWSGLLNQAKEKGTGGLVPQGLSVPKGLKLPF